MRRFFSFSILGALLFGLVSCKKIEGPRTELVFGTVCTVNAFNDGTASLYNELFSRLHELDNKFSTTISSSEIEKINSMAGVESVEASEEVLAVLKIALAFSKVTDGAFDPTIGPVVKLWGINTDHAHVPEKAELDKALALVGWQKVQIEGNKVFLPQKGMRLDLGGIVKGYAADVLKDILKTNGVKQAIIDLGGNVYTVGRKKDKSLWRIGIKNPQAPEGSPAAVLSLPEVSVVTSGVYERYFIKDGVRYHHIIDAKTGYPVDNGITAVSIISESSTACDALSTSLFILGMEKGFALIEELEKENILTKGVIGGNRTANTDAKNDSTDGMGMWLFGSGAVSDADNSSMALTANGLPYIEKPEGFNTALNAVYIDSENQMYPTAGLESIIK
ncbi:MAG: FAD:protein FMN transferase [Treponema sp.]|nr:FAD:protein FMN transferase [Treponema sp.]